jgi:hypothetical protein
MGISTRRELSKRTLAAVIIFSAIGPGEARTTDDSEGHTLWAALESTGLVARRRCSGDSKVSRAKPSVRVDGGRQYGNNWLREGSRGP